MSASGTDIAQAAGEKLRQEVAAGRLHTRGTGSLPLDIDRARIELTEEQRARRTSRPTSRRWRGLTKLDDKIDQLTLRLDEAQRELQRADERVKSAPDVDARTLADWYASGERGKRPEATLYERQRERDAANLTIEARQRTLDAAIEERFHYIEKHREKMLADARNDVEAKVEQTLAHVRAIPALRQELVEARETLLWVAAYPEQVETFGFPHALALGLQKPIKDTLGTTARLDYTQIMQALEADADALAHAFSREQNEKLGQPIERTPETDAMWDSEIPDAWKRKQLEEAQQIAAYSLDPSKVAAEAKEFRPSP